MSRLRIATDVGGSFTDLVLQSMDSGHSWAWKVPTARDDPAAGVINAVRESGAPPPDVEFLIHGTTVGLNALLERRGARVCLIATSGFRDMCHIGGSDRDDLFALQFRKTMPLMPRRDTFAVTERLRPDGSVRVPLDREEIIRLATVLRDRSYDSVAVCLLYSYINPSHELTIREILSEELPNVSVTLSHEVAREMARIFAGHD